MLDHRPHRSFILRQFAWSKKGDHSAVLPGHGSYILTIGRHNAVVDISAQGGESYRMCDQRETGQGANILSGHTFGTCASGNYGQQRMQHSLLVYSLVAGLVSG
jgi:hypothetical protein